MGIEDLRCNSKYNTRSIYGIQITNNTKKVLNEVSEEMTKITTETAKPNKKIETMKEGEKMY